MENIDNKQLQDGLDTFLQDEINAQPCPNGECKIKSKDGLIERVRINKEIIVEDGRRLLNS